MDDFESRFVKEEGTDFEKRFEPEPKEPSYLEAAKVGFKGGLAGAARMYEIPFRPIVERFPKEWGISPEQVLPSEMLKPTEEEQARVAELGIPGQLVSGAAALPGAALKYMPLMRGVGLAARTLGIPKIAAGAGIFPIERATEELVHEKKIPSGRELGEEAAVGGIFAGIEPLGRLARSAILSGTFGTQAFADTYAQTKDIKQALEAAVAPGVIGAGLGVLGPGRPERPIPGPEPIPWERRLPWTRPPFRPETPNLPVPYRVGEAPMDMVWNAERGRFEPSEFFGYETVSPRPEPPVPGQIPYFRGLPRLEGREFPPAEYPAVPYTPQITPPGPKIGPPEPLGPPTPAPTLRLEDITPERLKIPLLKNKLKTVLTEAEKLGQFSRNLIMRWAGIKAKRADRVADALVKAGLAEAVPSPPIGTMPFKFLGKFRLPGDDLRYAGEIRELREMVSRGEPGKKIGIPTKTLAEPGTVSWGISYPPFMQDRGWTQKDVLAAIDRGMRGDDFKNAPNLKEKWETVKQEARGMFTDRIHEERMRRKQAILQEPDWVAREETKKELISLEDNEIIGIKEELREQEYSEKEINRRVAEIGGRLAKEAPTEPAEIQKILTDEYTTQVEADPVLSYEALLAESEAKTAELRRIAEKYPASLSPTEKGQFKLPGMKIGVQGKLLVAPPTLEGTPLAEAARKAEIDEVQPKLFGREAELAAERPTVPLPVESKFKLDDPVKTTLPDGTEFKGLVREIDEDGTIRIGSSDGKMVAVEPGKVEADVPQGLPVEPKPEFKTVEETVEPSRLGTEDFQRISNSYSKANSPSKRFVENPEDLPEHILNQIPETERTKIQGAYDPVEGVTYLVRRNIENEASLKDVIDHEDIKHFALNTYLGKEANSWYERVYMKYGREGLKDIAAERGLDLSTKDGRIEAAREKIARTPIDTPGIIKQFWAWLREKIAKIFPDMKISDAEIQRNIKLATEAMERGELRGPREGPVEFATLPPEEQRIQDKIISKVKDPRTFKEKMRDAFDTFYSNYVSRWWPIEKIDPISGAGLRLASAKGYGVAQSALELGVPEINQIPGQPIKYRGEGLRQILAPVVDAKELPNFIRYGVSKRAIEKYHQGVETGFDYNDAVFTVNKYDNKMIGNQTYSQIFDRLGTFQDNILQYYRDSGMLSADAYNMIKAKNLMYFPFYRALEEMGPEGIGKGSQAVRVLKRMKGSDKPILDPIDNIVKNTYTMIANAEKNLALKNFVTQSPHLFTELKPGMPGYSTHRHSVSLYEMRKNPFFQEFLEDADLGLIDKNGNFRLKKGVKPQLEDEVVGIFRPNFIKGREDVFVVYENGKPRIFQTDKTIGRTLHAFDRESMSSVLRILSYPTKLLRAGAILSPEFMVRNPFRDMFSAMVYAKHGFYPWDFFKGLVEFGRKGPDYYRWLQGGGSLSSFISLDKSDLRDSVKQVLNRKKIQGVISGDTYTDILANMIKSPIEALRAITELSEMGTRLGIYKRALRKGAPEIEAIMESRESTLDFARIGAKSKAINMMIAFWNANVQGLDKMRRELNFINPETRPKALKTFAKASMTITIPSLLLAWANQDDPRYQELPEWQKALFWIIPTEKHLWRIPKPFELGMIFGSVPEYIMRWLRTNDPDTFKNIGSAMLTGSMPGMIPTAVLPFVENWANKSFFTGRPIVPMGKQELKPQYQYQPYTSETVKWVGKQMASLPILGDMASPAMIENFIRGWSGGLGGHALRLLDEALISSGIAPEEVKPSKTLADIPVIRAFVPRYPGSDAASLQKFYDTYNEVVALRTSANELMKQGKSDEATSLITENRSLMATYPMINKTHQAIKNMKGVIDKIYANPAISPEEKRRLIEETYMRMIEVAQSLNKRLRTIEQRPMELTSVPQFSILRP